MMQSEDKIRSWDRVPIGWVLCCAFGERNERAGPPSRPLLRRQVFGRGWGLRWCEQVRLNEWVISDGEAIAETDVEHSIEEAMCWALEELAHIANARALTYTKQQHTLMLELLRIRWPS